MERLHRPVMLEPCLEALNVAPGGVYADLTFGEGGHSEAILDRGAARVIGVDQDSETLDTYRAQGRLAGDPRLVLRHQRMSEFAAEGHGQIFDGCLADLGVSTRQLLTPERGFSLQADGPLDMRMDRTSDLTLQAYLEQTSESELAEALRRVADLNGSRSMARRICKAFQGGKLKSTADLARVAGGRWAKVHPATPVFMALRMIVNREFEEVFTSLPLLVEHLKPGGRLAVISFHSTEDRLVKRAFARLAGRCTCSSQPCECPRVAHVKLLHPKPILPSAEELERNPRSRSAKLRVVEKLMR